MQNETKKARRDEHRYDTRLIRDLLPRLKRARESGARGLNDLYQVISRQMIEEGTPGRKLSRSRLYRALKRLAELGLDGGLDDRATARKRRGSRTRDKNEDTLPSGTPLETGIEGCISSHDTG